MALFATIRPELQVRNPSVVDDTLAAGSTLESSASFLSDTLNGLASQTKRMLGTTNWYDALSNRSLTGLDTAVDTINATKMLEWVEVITDVTVGGSDNFVILSVSGSEAPSQTAAVGAVTTEGAVVAAHGGTFGTHALTEVSGANALFPKNLVRVIDASTGDAITSATLGNEIFGLLQSEVATDGHTFNDTTQQVQISFVEANGTLNDLIAATASDIQGKTIRYAYQRRQTFANRGEQAYLGSATFADQVAAVDFNLDQVIDNQSGAATVAANIDLDLAANIEWAYRDAASADLLRVEEGSGDSTSTVAITAAVDFLDVDAADVDFANGLGAGSLSLGETTDTLSGTADIHLSATTDLTFTDGQKSGSTYAGELKLSATSQEWSDFETYSDAEVSILAALVKALKGVQPTRTVMIPSTSITAGSALIAATNVDAAPTLTGVGTPSQDVVVYLNGQKLVMDDSSTGDKDYDCYINASNQLVLEFDVGTSDRLEVFVHAY